jgi:hypothetical protein
MRIPNEQWQSDAIWGVIVGAAIAAEVYAIRGDRLDHTLTRTTRRAFRTQHPVGKALFAIGWGYTAVWFLRHILEAGDPLDAVFYPDRRPEPWSMLLERTPWRASAAG